MTFNDEDKVAKLSIPEKFEIILIYIDDFFLSVRICFYVCLLSVKKIFLKKMPRISSNIQMRNNKWIPIFIKCNLIH